MTLPATIQGYYETLSLERDTPFCVEVDAQFNILQFWGEGTPYELEIVKVGADFSELAPFTVGSFLNQTLVLPMINLGEGAADIHIVPDTDSHFVLFIDRSQEMLRRRDKQQASNEVRLLNNQQRKLLNRQRGLIAELVEAKAQLESQRRGLEEGNARTTEFLAMMSHDFRTPLTSIIGYADELREVVVEEGEKKEAVLAITRGSKHILSLVENVLEKARLDTGHFHVQPTIVDLRELLTDVSAIMAPLAAEKELAFAATVDPAIPDRLMLDPGGVRQVLINLTGNAIKFTDKGAVYLSVGETDKRLELSVRDTGPGIADSDRERIFAAFERVQRSKTGTGLGLSITKQLVDLMGGSLALESSIGEGTKITISLPIVRVNTDGQTELSQHAKAAAEGKTGRILMVEDNADIRRLVELALTRGGHQLVLAGDGLEAIHLAIQHEPDVVLMDINLPNMDGHEAAQQLRQMGFQGKIVAFTANRNVDEDRTGFDGVIRKPIKMAELLTQLSVFL